MSDEEYYLQAKKEIESGTKDPATWVKAQVLSSGELDRSQHEYIRLRVESFKGTDVEMTGVNGAAPASKSKDGMFLLGCLAAGFINTTIMRANGGTGAGGAYFFGEAFGSALGLLLTVYIFALIPAIIFRLATGKEMRILFEKLRWWIFSFLEIVLAYSAFIEA